MTVKGAATFTAKHSRWSPPLGPTPHCWR
jgi:hypothetical protein